MAPLNLPRKGGGREMGRDQGFGIGKIIFQWFLGKCLLFTVKFECLPSTFPGSLAHFLRRKVTDRQRRYSQLRSPGPRPPRLPSLAPPT